jgi:radical SAM protein with 4Fe4S-binding SPASM domain
MKQAEIALIQPRIYSAKKRALEDLVPLSTPISAHIDISSLCNFRCSFCFQADTKGMKAVGLKRGFMPIEMFKKIVDDLRDFPDKIKKIKIGNHGEPTLHPNCAEVIEYARSSETADVVEMFTNGSKLTTLLNKDIVSAGLQRINISLEGLSDERYLAVAGVKQEFSEIVNGVKDLYARKKAAKSDLVIYVKIADQAHALKGESNQVFTLTENERKFFFDTFKEHCDEIFIEKVVPQWAETQENKQNNVDSTGMYGQRVTANKDVCPFVFMYMHFNCDGSVSPCTLDWPRKVIIGNVLNESVKQIWTGSRMRSLQAAMLEGYRSCISLCQSCSAPLVCVEENLDPHKNILIERIDPGKQYRSTGNNEWIKPASHNTIKLIRK